MSCLAQLPCLILLPNEWNGVGQDRSNCLGGEWRSLVTAQLGIQLWWSYAEMFSWAMGGSEWVVVAARHC